MCPTTTTTSTETARHPIQSPPSPPCSSSATTMDHQSQVDHPSHSHPHLHHAPQPSYTKQPSHYHPHAHPHQGLTTPTSAPAPSDSHHHHHNTPPGLNVIRVKASGQMKAYIEYAKKHLDMPLAPGPVTLRVVAVGSAIAKAISIAEILKRQYDTLHQTNTLTRFHPDPSQMRDRPSNGNGGPAQQTVDGGANGNASHYTRRITSCLTIDLVKNNADANGTADNAAGTGNTNGAQQQQTQAQQQQPTTVNVEG